MPCLGAPALSWTRILASSKPTTEAIDALVRPCCSNSLHSDSRLIWPLANVFPFPLLMFFLFFFFLLQIIQLVFVFRFICFFLLFFFFCMSRDHLNSSNVVTIIWIHSIKSNKLLFWVSVMSKHFCMDLILIFWLSLSISWFKILQVQHHTSHQKLRQQRRVTYALQGSGLSVRYKLIFVIEFSGLLS